MAQERIAVPNIGDSRDVDVVEVLVKVGDRIEREQTLIVLESEKASMDVPAPRAGVVKELLIKPGDKASEGTPILILDSDGIQDAQVSTTSKPERATASAPEPGAPAPAAAVPDASSSSGPALEQIAVPNIGDSHDVDVVEVQVKVGDRIEREQTLIVLESEKASMDVPSPRAGVVKQLLIKAGDKASEGTPILVIEVEAGQGTGASEKRAGDSPASSPRAAAPAGPRGATPDAVSGQRVRTVPPVTSTPSDDAAQPSARPNGAGLPYASPAIRRFARELGVDLTNVHGTARKGRITKEDVQQYVKRTLREPARGAGLLVPEAPEIDFSQFGPIAVQPLTKIQRLTGKNLHRSWVTIPHVTQFDEADITELEEFRKQIRSEKPGLKLTLVTFFLKALVHCLRQMPRFNASLDKSGDNLVMKQYFHIGVAVDTPNGLVVPVIRDVDRKGLAELAQELETTSERARAKKLSPSDMQGASISISSLGGIGGTAFTPIINPPEVAILGVSRARMAPVYQKGAFVPRLMCPLSLSYDHRVIDGADGARFTKLLGEVLGDIRQLLL